MRFLEKSLGGIMKTLPTLSLGTDNHSRFAKATKPQRFWWKRVATVHPSTILHFTSLYVRAADAFLT